MISILLRSCHELFPPHSLKNPRSLIFIHSYRWHEFCRLVFIKHIQDPNFDLHSFFALIQKAIISRFRFLLVHVCQTYTQMTGSVVYLWIKIQTWMNSFHKITYLTWGRVFQKFISLVKQVILNCFRTVLPHRNLFNVLCHNLSCKYLRMFGLRCEV